MFSKKTRSGQAILITVIAIGAVLLGATTIAGLLSLYQLRRAGDFANSTKAVYAADAGLESALYNKFKCDCTLTTECPVLNPPGTPLSSCPTDAPQDARCSSLSNGAVVIVECLDNNRNINCYDPSSYDPNRTCRPPGNDVRAIRSTGRSVNSFRTFLQQF